METLHNSNDFTLLRYPNNVYEFIFKSTTRTAADELFAQMARVVDLTPEHGAMLLLLNVSVGIVPVSYAMKQGREFIKAYPNPRKARAAILYKDSFIMSIAGPSLHLLRLPRLNFMLFHETQREKAIEWLTYKEAFVPVSN